MIWKEGMAEWVTVSRVPALMKYVKKPEPAAMAAAPQPAAVAPQEEAAPVESLPAGQVGYYNPSGSMPPRAAQTLRMHARPRGDTGDWPLDDARVAQFDQAWKLRKRIDGAASLFRLLFLLIAIADVVGLIGGAVALSNARGPSAMASLFFLLGAGSVYVGLTVLHYFAWKGTVRSQAWAPLTMGILFSLGAAGYVALMFFVGMASGPRDTTAVYAGFGFAVLIVGALAYVSFRGFAAIGPYLRQPAWCQELLSKTSGK
jgi:hypothetical protein